MRIEQIELSWFRGASEKATLDTASKSVVIYGANGAGKSSFCDAIEYILSNGKIDHLSHEYSGVRQEKGVRNTHTPDERPSTISVNFDGDLKVGVEIACDGTPTFESNPTELVDYMQSWELEQFVLRQDEVAKFVIKTKGGKYSALLPLLGLEKYEQVAENLVLLRSHVIERSNLASKKAKLTVLEGEALKHLPDLSEASVLTTLSTLAKDYITGDIPPERQTLSDVLSRSIEARIGSMTPEITRYTLLNQIIEEDMPSKLAGAKKTFLNMQGQVDTLLDSRIDVLEKAQDFLDRLEISEGEIECPACGQPVKAENFIKHVKDELKSLEQVRTAREAHKLAWRTLVNSLDKIRGIAQQETLALWIKEEAPIELKDVITDLNKVDFVKWYERYPVKEEDTLDKIVIGIVSQVEKLLKRTPPSINKIVEDRETVNSANSVDEINTLKQETVQIHWIIGALDSSETAVREFIKTTTKGIIDQISVEIQSLWAKLHPNEPIEDVKLYMPDEAEKAIDISLKFFGVEQPSPRLTLSEGHRNSLGLCIFLAFSRLGSASTRPILLDDIVSSWDREHRGMLVKILTQDFKDRQVLLFTHEREWFQELRLRLPSTDWKFFVLKPWKGPDVGLQWSHSEDTFDDARDLIEQDPEAAGNCVRRIMDTHLGIIAENLQINMPYRRGDRNDHRTCVDFIERLISEGKARFRIRTGEEWLGYEEPISSWLTTRGLLIAWGDRSSHTGSMVRNEVEELIEACQASLNSFRCAGCNSFVWSADRTRQERLQCNCGKLQWRYG